MKFIDDIKERIEKRQLDQWNKFSNAKLDVKPEELNEIAEVLSKRFTYSQLKNERKEVIGELRELVKEKTRAYLHHYVLEKACSLIRQKWEPEIVRVIPENLLSSYHKIPIELMDEVNLVDYPLQYFTKAIILSPTEDLTASLKIIQNDDIYYERYKLKGTRAIGDTILMAWILPNVPMLLLAYSPAMGQPFCEIKKHIENASDQFKEIYTRYIFEQNEQVNNYKYMLVEKEQEVRVTAKRAEDYKADKEFLLRTRELVNGEEDPTKITISRVMYYILSFCSFLGFICLALLIGK